MDEKTLDLLARRAGLEKALAQFPDDVAAAASSAERVTERVRRSGGASSPLLEPSAEPWPPMVVVRA